MLWRIRRRLTWLLDHIDQMLLGDDDYGGHNILIVSEHDDRVFNYTKYEPNYDT